MVTDLTQESFDQEVLQAQIPVLLDFWGPACKPCLALMPAVDRLAVQNAGQLKVMKVNSPQNRQLCIRLRVLGLPTFLLFHQGREIGRLSGQDISAQQVAQFIQPHVQTGQ